ncbi:hypothetical protein FKM82_019053 [Ascaphus truei]
MYGAPNRNPNIPEAEHLKKTLLGHSNLSAHKNQGKRHLFEESLSLKSCFEWCVERCVLKVSQSGLTGLPSSFK